MTDQELLNLFGSITEWLKPSEARDRYDAEIERRKLEAVTSPPPEGFAVTFLYRDGHFPYQNEDVFVHVDTGFTFDADVLPKLPLRYHGRIDHMGWDIPTQYAIDVDGQCFMDNGHGGGLQPCSTYTLLSTCESEDTVATLRGVLGMRPQLPSWMQKALDAGWTPPASFDRSRYE